MPNPLREPLSVEISEEERWLGERLVSIHFSRSVSRILTLRPIRICGISRCHQAVDLRLGELQIACDFGNSENMFIHLRILWRRSSIPSPNTVMAVHLTFGGARLETRRTYDCSAGSSLWIDSTPYILRLRLPVLARTIRQLVRILAYPHAPLLPCQPTKKCALPPGGKAHSERHSTTKCSFSG